MLRARCPKCLAVRDQQSGPNREKTKFVRLIKQVRVQFATMRRRKDKKTDMGNVFFTISGNRAELGSLFSTEVLI